MDDIDRTFAALKKTENMRLNAILSQAQNNYVIINPHTFCAEVPRPLHQIVINNGWTVEDFQTKLNNPYDNK